MTKKLTEEISVAAQISPSEVAGLAASGFKSIICNRPDGEAPDQPAFREIAEAAGAAGLEARYLPVTPGTVSGVDAAALGAALAELPKPVLAYCRSGMRSTLLWAMSQGHVRPAEEIIDIARRAGFDVIGVVGSLAKPKTSD